MARKSTVAEEKAYAMRIMEAFVTLAECAAEIPDIDEMVQLIALYMLAHGTEARLKQMFSEAPSGLSMAETVAHVREVAGILYDTITKGEASPEQFARLAALMKGIGG